MLQKLRNFLKSDMRVLRWVLLGLYLLLILTPPVLCFAGGDGDSLIIVLCWLGVMLLLQGLFIVGSGTIQLCRPMRRRRLVFPVAVASFMMALLLFALLLAGSELIHLTGNDYTFWSVVGICVLSWAGWGLLFWHRYRESARHTVMARLALWMFSGSLLELLACVPMHVIVSRRPGCFVGILTMLGIIGGCCVMCFAFGPAIVLLFLRPRHREELARAGERYCDVCGYDLRASANRCPECGTRFSV